MAEQPFAALAQKRSHSNSQRPGSARRSPRNIHIFITTNLLGIISCRTYVLLCVLPASGPFAQVLPCSSTETSFAAIHRDARPGRPLSASDKQVCNVCHVCQPSTSGTERPRPCATNCSVLQAACGSPTCHRYAWPCASLSAEFMHVPRLSRLYRISVACRQPEYESASALMA